MGASVMSSRLRMNRIVSLPSFFTGATKTLHRNLLPETTEDLTSTAVQQSET